MQIQTYESDCLDNKSISSSFGLVFSSVLFFSLPTQWGRKQRSSSLQLLFLFITLYLALPNAGIHSSFYRWFFKWLQVCGKSSFKVFQRFSSKSSQFFDFRWFVLCLYLLSQHSKTTILIRRRKKSTFARHKSGWMTLRVNENPLNIYSTITKIDSPLRCLTKNQREDINTIIPTILILLRTRKITTTLNEINRNISERQSQIAWKQDGQISEP